MSDNLRQITVKVESPGGDAKSVNVYLFDRSVRFGRYQVRTNADGRRDVYYSDIEGASFSKTRKVPKANGPAPCGDQAVATMAEDLARMGLSAPDLLDPGFAIWPE